MIRRIEIRRIEIRRIEDIIWLINWQRKEE